MHFNANAKVHEGGELCVCECHVLLHLCPPQLCSDDISELERKHAATITKMTQARRKLKELSTRVLKVQTCHMPLEH